MTNEEHAKMIRTLRDDTLIWSPDFDAIRLSLANYLEAVQKLVSLLEPEEKETNA